MRRRLDSAARGVGLTPTLQPIVALPAGGIVGFEALARWPSLDNPSPTDVFAYAAATGQLDALDQLCMDAAIRTALSLRLPHGTMLAINCEPESVYLLHHDAALARARDELALMFELTERNLLTHPQALLRKVAALRREGFLIALDDVGVHPDSLALLDVLAPDVIKLDLQLVQSRPSRDQARTLAAVMAHQERTGAMILAEGIENAEHLEQALALGAALGQGHKYTFPGPFDETGTWPPPAQPPPSRNGSGSPFELVAGDIPLRTAPKKTLNAFSRHIETQARYTADPPMVLAALQQAQYFTTVTQRRYLALARSAPLVAIFGEHLPADLGAGIRGVHLDPTDPLRTEWIVLALGAQIAVALIARERQSDSDPEQQSHDGERRFDFTITHNRSLVTRVAHNLLARML
ncbi:hypothetical protein NGTWS0302_09840 [Mycolicibacterium cyprinidarum]|uniref:EAL domain-containing protein n=1 Tax=Mycolicibacterium cyprinidarum TaxID=2860311 RepID=A0ABQ4V9H7_9MYCO|nr:hypothetical protein NGTWS1803_23480 [Mycolicibacterium sp. NGTWS1803]GJF13694.1 hypothetical protein NGTWS1702_14420 [Mycolicibacterium sp. NGTWSNA01]GJF15698.1 hypothetical protein NGTWS0302_09840 [Mycolicibacterium sp. NGTWS0302]